MFRPLLIITVLLFSGCSKEKTERPMLQTSAYATVAPSLTKGQPTLLEMGSTDCASCRDMAALLYQIKRRYPRSRIYFIDIKRERDVGSHYSVRMMPTQIYLDGSGKEIERHIGAMDPDELVKKLKRIGIIVQ